MTFKVGDCVFEDLGAGDGVVVKLAERGGVYVRFAHGISYSRESHLHPGEKDRCADLIAGPKGWLP